jgi:hypothetical protein
MLSLLFRMYCRQTEVIRLLLFARDSATTTQIRAIQKSSLRLLNELNVDPINRQGPSRSRFSCRGPLDDSSREIGALGQDPQPDAEPLPRAVAELERLSVRHGQPDSYQKEQPSSQGY